MVVENLRSICGGGVLGARVVGGGVLRARVDVGY